MYNQQQSSNHGSLDLAPHQQEALSRLLAIATPKELLYYLRRYYGGFVYNAQGNIELEDHHYYREMDKFLEGLSKPIGE